MRTKIPIQITIDNGDVVGKTLWSEEHFIKNLSFRENNDEKLMELVSIELEKEMHISGTEYISSHSNDGNFVRCPDAFVKLPIDSFCCKHNQENCFIGGGIYKKNKQDFIDKCMIEERKEGIWNAIATEKYEGFHHVPGRYLCPSCETKNSAKRINYNYHYPWELCSLAQFLDFKDIELRKEVIKKGISRNIYYSSFCGTCAMEILETLRMEINLRIIETEVYRKTKNDA